MSRTVKCIAGLCSGIGTGDVLRTFGSRFPVDQNWLFGLMIVGTVLGLAGAAFDCSRTPKGIRDCNVTVISWQLILVAVAAPLATDAFSLGPALFDAIAVGSFVPWFVGWSMQVTGAFRIGGPFGPPLTEPEVRTVATARAR